MESILQTTDWHTAFVVLGGVLTRATLALLAFYGISRMLPHHASLRHAVLVAGLLSVLAMPILSASLLCVNSPHISINLPFELMTGTSLESVDLGKEPYPARGSTDLSPLDVENGASAPVAGWGFGFALIITTWTLVSCVRTIGLLRSFIQLRHLVNHAGMAECAQVQRLVDEFRMQFRFRREIAVLTSTQITSPVSVGVVRNCVVLPPGLTDSLSSDELKAILFHELAHLQRRDHVVVILQEILQTLLWWHPLARLVNRELTRAREEVCDNYVLQTADAESYSEALLTISRLLYPPTETAGATPLWGDRWNLESRVSSILDERRTVMTSLNLRTSVVVTTLCSLISLVLAATGLSHDTTDGKKRFEGNRDFSDTEMIRLKDMLDLEVLSLENSQVTDVGLKHLSELSSLEHLNLNGTDITDNGLAHLKKLTNLKSLALSGTKVTSAGLSNIKGLNNLTELYLFDTNVTDDGLKYLESLTQLTILNLARTHITDKGLKHLQQMKKLQNLFLGFTGVTDAGLPSLAGMKDLRGLYLVRTNISDQGLQGIQALDNLDALWLSYTNVSDSGLVHLKEFTKLKDLNLSGTRITDSGLKYFSGLTNLQTLHIALTRTGSDGLAHFKSLHNLRSLYVTHTAVDEESVDKLQRELPNLKIHGPGA